MSSSKDDKLQAFIKKNIEANAVIIAEDNIFEIISYNGFHSVKKFKRHLENVSRKAAFAHINYLTSIKCDPKSYLACIKHQIAEVMMNIQQLEDYLYHKKISVCDRNDNVILFSELPVLLKQKIGSFTAVQQQSLISFISKLNGSHPTENSELLWLGTKTDLVELGNALYESGTIGSKNGNVTKKEFIESFSSFMNIDIVATHKTLNKAILRNNPSQFIDKLKHSFHEYIDKKYET